MTSRLDFLEENFFSRVDVHMLLMGLTWKGNDFFSTFLRKRVFLFANFGDLILKESLLFTFSNVLRLRKAYGTLSCTKNAFCWIWWSLYANLTAVRLFINKSDCRLSNEPMIANTSPDWRCFQHFRHLDDNMKLFEIPCWAPAIHLRTFTVLWQANEASVHNTKPT